MISITFHPLDRQKDIVHSTLCPPNPNLNDKTEQ